MTDSVSEFDNIDDIVGLEKMAYPRFYMTYATRRPTQAPNKFDSWSGMQLPNDSVLHSLNGFDTLQSPSEGMPDPALPLVTNERLPIYLFINAPVVGEHDVPFGVKDNYIYRPSTLTPSIAHFYQEHRRYHRVLSQRTLGTMGGVLTWIDYSPLNEMRVNGTLGVYRKFDILFRTILDNVVKIGAGRNHYIHLPQGNQVFAKGLMSRTFKELTTGSLNMFLEDPSIFPILHLLGYVFGRTNKLAVTPYKSDVNILGKDSATLSGLRSTSLLERLPTDMFSAINFIIQKDDRAIVYNLQDLATFSDDPSFYTKFYRHMMNVRLAGATIPPHVDPDSEQFDTLVSSLSASGSGDQVGDQEVVAIGADVKQEPEPPKALAPEPRALVDKLIPSNQVDDLRLPAEAPVAASFEEKIRTAIVTKDQKSQPLEPKAVTRRNQLIENHFNVTIGGKTLGELIQSPPVQSITPKKMDFLTATPEASYQSSSLLAMDKAYQTHAYHHEMAKVIGSLAKHGYYASKIEEEHLDVEMDRTVTYKVSLTDMGGKVHMVKFTLPHVDENGLMKLSGVEYRLTRQIANVPICKVSPTRVSLSSYYNKMNIDRIQSKRNSYEEVISKLILDLKTQGLLQSTAGSAPLPTRKVPYDYSALGRNFTQLIIDGFTFQLGGDGADHTLLPFTNAERLAKLETTYGVFVGIGPDATLLFWDMTNQIHQVDGNDKLLFSWKSFGQFLIERLGEAAVPKKAIAEWTQAEIINQTIPLVFLLGFRFGLKAVLDMIRLDYRFYPTGTRALTNHEDIAVKFGDGTLVFNRYPLSRSLIAGGLQWVKLNDINFRDMAIPETYIRVFQKKGMTPGVLKGLSGFFDFFVDPITETVLEKMGEPTTFHELLLRANVMLTDYVAEEPTSVGMHRFRHYERFNGTIYNEIYRGLANYRNNPNTRKSFSINPEAVFQKIVQDATVTPNDVINPVHEVKQRANFTFTGGGGRSAKSLVLKDRVYPKDGLGVISESVPDSGKVGITAYLSASPNITDIHGMPKPYKEGDVLEPPQILSIGSMVMPGGTTDDGKRNNYLSIQISHYVPNNEEGETLSCRTGYDEVLPHLSGDTFASAAEEDGVVESINPKEKVVRVRYKDTLTPTLRALTLPYIDSVLLQYRDAGKAIGFLIPEDQIADFPMGGIFSLSKTVNGKIVDRLRCDTIEAIPDKDSIRKQHNLVQDFERGRYKALYFIRFNLLKITTPGSVKSFSYADVYSPISGSYLLQKRVPNIQEGETFKAGDILVYNPGFYVPDPMSKQVTFKHGVVATIALVEKSTNHEDACEISRDFSSRLKMTPCHQRQIVTKNDAALLKIVKVGDQVETSDSLCIISDEYLIQSNGLIDVENLDIMEKLNRQTPAADYTGTIRKIRVLYSGEREKLSESLQQVLKAYEKEARDSFKALNTNPNIKPPEKPGWVAPGTKYAGIDFTPETVVIEFMIEETLDVLEGDKICIANANKSIVSYVNDKPHFTESGIPIDILFSTTSVINRIVASPFTIGMIERNCEALKEKVLSLYFDE